MATGARWFDESASTGVRKTVSLVVVERLPGAAVFPVEGTGRRWWRDTTFAQRERYVELAADAPWLAPPMPTHVSPSDRQVLAPLRRAVDARDPVQRVVALWEAIEFYVGDRSPEAQFTDAEVKGAIDRAREGLTGVKAERVGNLSATCSTHGRFSPSSSRCCTPRACPTPTMIGRGSRGSARRAAGRSTAPRRTRGRE